MTDLETLRAALKDPVTEPFHALDLVGLHGAGDAGDRQARPRMRPQVVVPGRVVRTAEVRRRDDDRVAVGNAE